MVGIDFEKAKPNVSDVIKVRNKYFTEKKYYCRVTLQLTFMENNMSELADIIRLASELGVDRVKGHHLWAHFKQIKDLSFRRNKESINQWNQYVNEAYEAQNKYLKPDNTKVLLENIIPLQEQEFTEVPKNYECPFLSKELWISATGKISPCCAPDEMRRSLGDFGNIENISIEEVMQSEVYLDLVNNYKNIELCKTCNMRKPK